MNDLERLTVLTFWLYFLHHHLPSFNWKINRLFPLFLFLSVHSHRATTTWTIRSPLSQHNNNKKATWTKRDRSIQDCIIGDLQYFSLRPTKKFGLDAGSQKEIRNRSHIINSFHSNEKDTRKEICMVHPNPVYIQTQDRGGQTNRHNRRKWTRKMTTSSATPVIPKILFKIRHLLSFSFILSSFLHTLISISNRAEPYHFIKCNDHRTIFHSQGHTSHCQTQPDDGLACGVKSPIQHLELLSSIGTFDLNAFQSVKSRTHYGQHSSQPLFWPTISSQSTNKADIFRRTTLVAPRTESEAAAAPHPPPMPSLIQIQLGSSESVKWSTMLCQGERYESDKRNEADKVCRWQKISCLFFYLSLIYCLLMRALHWLSFKKPML